MDLFLYEIFWSHFCEKSRWCLDYKGLHYLLVAVNPLTRREVQAVGARGDVPVLKDGDQVVTGSDAIALHLEENYPDPPLLPGDPAERAEVLEIERKCDTLLGPDARRLAYEVALAHPSILEGTLLWSRPPRRWLNPLAYRFLEPKLRRKFNIYSPEIAASRARLPALLADLQARAARGGYLVGGRLTLADITAVSLMDPLELVPEFVRDRHFAPLFEWKRRLARSHGRRQRTPWQSGQPPRGYPSRLKA
jgi:glutathione S-transferase